MKIRLDHFSRYGNIYILLKPVKKGHSLEYVRYAYPLQSASRPYPSPCLPLVAQGESTFLLIEVTGIPFVPMKPGKTFQLSV